MYQEIQGPSILHSSPYLQLCYAENKGRYLTAKRDIPKETLVFSTTAYATNVLESFKKRICFVCLKFNEKGRFELHCKNCAQAYFCSEACQTTFLHANTTSRNNSNNHNDECEYLRKLWGSRFGLHIVSVLSLAVFILKRRTFELLTSNNNNGDNSGVSEALASLLIDEKKEEKKEDEKKEDEKKEEKKEEEKKEEEKKEEEKKDDEKKENNNNTESLNPRKILEEVERMRKEKQERERREIDKEAEENSNKEIKVKTQYHDVHQLVEHYKSIPDFDLNYYRKGIAMMKSMLTGKLREMNKDILGGEGDNNGIINEKKTEEILLRLVSKIESNGFGVWKDDICMGRALYPLASFFNHSCDPNCCTRQETGKLYIYTLKDIKKGDEMCISYIDSNLPRCNRQLSLKRDYYFDCCCERCEKELKEPPKAHKFSYSKSVNHSLKGKKGEEKIEQRKKEKREMRKAKNASNKNNKNNNNNDNENNKLASGDNNNEPNEHEEEEKKETVTEEAM